MAIIVVFFSILSFVFDSYTGICGPLQAPWFSHTFQVTPPDVPQGVVINYNPATYVLELSNTTDIPLYVYSRYISTNSGAKYPQTDISTPDYEAWIKVINGRVFYWHQYDNVWESDDNTSGQATLTLNNMDSSQIFDKQYTNENPYTAEERLPQISIPAPQTTFILLSYNGSRINIPIMVTYSLNENYESERNAAPPCSPAFMYTIAYLVYETPCVIVLVLASLVGFFLMLWSKGQRRA